MSYLCNLNVYITVEAATLIALTFIAFTSILFRSVMARKKKSGSAKGPQSAAGPKPAGGQKVTDAKGVVQAKPGPVAPPVIQEIDNRPETSPYGSPACTIPFASPLTMPLDILKKSPKLHAAYEDRLPELPAIPGDVGHILVHYLHTGTYGSLKPKSTDKVSKQICELKTSIQTYAAARAYDLPDLMRLAEAKIDKYGEGLPLPSLLEVARDAYPTLTEGDDWFLDYLRSRIRPHLKDPKSLLGSDLLDQISSILSPNKVLLRTVLELFCERIAVRPEPASPPAASPITSPGSSRPATPLPSASPMSLLEMRSRSILREEFPSARKKATPLPSPDAMSEAPRSKEASPAPSPPAAVSPKPRQASKAKHKSIPAPGPAILDVVPQLDQANKVKAAVTPKVETAVGRELNVDIEPQAKPTVEPEAKVAVESEVKGAVESEVKAAVEPEVKAAVEPEIKAAVEPEIKAAVEPEAKTAVEPEINAAVEPEVEVAVEPEAKAAVEPEVNTAIKSEDKPAVEPEAKTVEPEVKAVVEPDVKPAAEPDVKAAVESEVEPTVGPEVGAVVAPEIKQEMPQDPILISQRERKDSGKGIELEPVIKELDVTPEPEPQRPVVREVDSGFWDYTPAEVEPAREPAPAVMELEPAESTAPVQEPKEVSGVDARDFAGSDADGKTDKGKTVDTESEPLNQSVATCLPAPQSATEAAVEVAPKIALEPISEPEPVPSILAEEAAERVTEAEKPEFPSRTTAEESMPEMGQSKEVEAQPETEKAQETVEPDAVAKPKSEATSSKAVNLSDDSQPTESTEPEAAQPGLVEGSKSALEPEIQRADTDATTLPVPPAVAEPVAVTGAKDATEQENAKDGAEPASIQPCGAQARQRSWKKRFLSLRYPVLFGRGM
ncbi:Coiled-coil domain-containing protein 8 [Madurella mycetomatis]|uniref:Coiled-coil domain-containing protein 8 n=1 Tax=Madurella mycetomatis TaxID=100816 RepID=A0A175VY97_9PEZI|nr:Coiled-coil domain-containing protein 8 [Madurella mycetomatis]KXX76149.1 Coiled-coil domain-containing protein 8 [Madurella mycetomatis]